MADHYRDDKHFFLYKIYSPITFNQVTEKNNTKTNNKKLKNRRKVK